MEIITDNFNNISINQLNSKLSQKYAQLQKIDETQKVGDSKLKFQDYVELSVVGVNDYDENDYERVLNKFKQTEVSVRTHEQTHASIGLPVSPISYNYQEGPDGKMYVVGGSVRLDTSIPNDPKAAAFKMEQIKKASNGPVDLSGADISISTQANLNKILLNIQGANDAS
jgi:hypothetical protein